MSDQKQSKNKVKMKTECWMYEEVLVHLVQHKKSRALSIYCALKLMYIEGNLKTQELDYSRLLKLTGVKDERTIKSAMQTLFELRYIKINKANNRIYISSQKSLKTYYKWRSKLIFRITPKDIRKDKILSFATAVLFTIVYIRIWNKIYSKSKKLRRAVKIDGKDYFLKSRKNIYKSFVPISISLITKVFGIPGTTVERNRNNAYRNKYISIKRSYDKIGKSSEFHLLRKIHLKNKPNQRLKKFNGGTFIRRIDLIKPEIKFKKKR